MQEENQKKTSNSVNVKITRHPLSPFTVYLQRDSENSAVDTEKNNNQSICLNLLDATALSVSDSPNKSDDLSLTAEDLRDQLLEHTLAWKKNTTSITKGKPNHKTYTTKIEITDFTQPSFPVSAVSFQPVIQKDPVSEKITLSNPTEDSWEQYFDLPEAEEDDENESDLVLFEEIVLNTIAPEEDFFEEAPIWHFSWKRSLAVFVAVAILLSSPISLIQTTGSLLGLENGLMASSNIAISALERGANAAQAADSNTAVVAFQTAENNFSKAKTQIEDLGTITQTVLSALPVSGTRLKTAEALLSAGESLSQAGSQLSTGFDAIQTSSITTPTTRLRLVHTYLQETLPFLENAINSLSKANPAVLPEKEAEKLKKVQLEAPAILSLITDLTNMTAVGAEMLGGSGTRRYLLVFQNNTELRATGGFIGSFAEIQITDGAISKLIVPGGGSYDLQGQLKRTIIAPKPLQLLRERWEFQDANWFPDYPTSARTIMELYEASGGPTMDGVVAVNATYVADLLDLLGPVDLTDEYGRMITKENFLEETQKIVELEYDTEENKPKAFIGDLAPILLERAFEKTAEDFFDVLEHVLKGLRERDIQIYLRNNEEQKEIHRFLWDGSMRQTDRDFLLITNTNLGGGKTDLSIEEDINVDINISSSGKITNTLTITRRHFGSSTDLFANTNNVNYVRAYVPRGSRLISATGFAIPDEDLFEAVDPKAEILNDLYYTLETESIDPNSKTATWEESGKTVFGNWIQTKPGSTTTTTFTYELPFTFENLVAPIDRKETIKRWLGFVPMDHYSLLVQHQSGSRTRHTTATINLPNEVSSLWSTGNIETVSFADNEDDVFSVLLTPTTLE